LLALSSLCSTQRSPAPVQGGARRLGYHTKMRVVESSMSLLDWVQLLALLAAGVYFTVRVLQGWLIVNVSLSIATERIGLRVGKDGLAIAVTITKGSVGSVRIEDTLVRVVSPNGFVGREPLTGTRRVIIDPVSYQIDPDFQERSKNVLYRFPPGESTVWSCWLEVPSEEVCTVEVVVIGHQRPSRFPAQWRASSVSLPNKQPPI